MTRSLSHPYADLGLTQTLDFLRGRAVHLVRGREGVSLDKKRYTYDYPRPMVTVDAVVFAVRDGALHVLLVERKYAPFAGTWALPGGFVDMDEALATAAARELREETGLAGLDLVQYHTFGDPGRDPRGRSISVAYWAFVDDAQCEPRAGDDAAAVGWFPVAALPELAFDHRVIVEYAVAAFRAERGQGAASPCLEEMHDHDD